MIGKEIIFLYKALLLGVAATILIPKEYYKKYFSYGLIYGGLLDVIIVLILEAFNLIQYRNMGVFSIFGKFTFWTPIAWLFVVMFYLYFLPGKKLYLYLYILSFTCFGIMVGVVLGNFGLYSINPIYRYLQPFVISGWFGFTAWIYIKTERIDIR